MRKFRIVGNGKVFKIQRKVFGLIWLTVDWSDDWFYPILPGSNCAYTNRQDAQTDMNQACKRYKKRKASKGKFYVIDTLTCKEVK